MFPVIAIASVLASAEVAPPPARYSAEELCEQIAAAVERIDSLCFVYRSGDMSRKNSGFPPESYLHRRVAVKRPGYFLHWNSHGHAGMEWGDDPFQQRLFVDLDGWTNLNPVSNYFAAGTLKPTDALPGTAGGEMTLAATGLWPMNRPARRFRGEPYFLHDIVETGLYTTVRPAQEIFAGRWSHVLERPGFDRLWLDSVREGVLLARETHDPKTCVLLQRFELLQHVEAAPGVWLPTKIRNMQFRASGADSRSELVKDALLTYVEVRANDVPAELFDFEASPGALELTPGKMPAQIPGGIEHLDDLIDWSRRNVPEPIRTKDSAWPQWLICGAGMAAVAFIEWRRKSH